MRRVAVFSNGKPDETMIIDSETLLPLPVPTYINYCIDSKSTEAVAHLLDSNDRIEQVKIVYMEIDINADRAYAPARATAYRKLHKKKKYLT